MRLLLQRIESAEANEYWATAEDLYERYFALEERITNLTTENNNEEERIKRITTKTFNSI